MNGALFEWLFTYMSFHRKAKKWISPIHRNLRFNSSPSAFPVSQILYSYKLCWGTSRYLTFDILESLECHSDYYRCYTDWISASHQCTSKPLPQQIQSYLKKKKVLAIHTYSINTADSTRKLQFLFCARADHNVNPQHTRSGNWSSNKIALMVFCHFNSDATQYWWGAGWGDCWAQRR